LSIVNSGNGAPNAIAVTNRGFPPYAVAPPAPV
jgi:hypothetical protein